MATARPFSYNPGSTGAIPGTEQIGNLAIGTPAGGFAATGLQWWNGPDEDLGYVIAKSISSGTQPNPLNVPAYLGFNRSVSLTEASFVSLTNVIAGPSGPFSTGSDSKTWLNSNGYWTSYPGVVTSNLILYYDPSLTPSYPGTGTTLSDLSGNGLNGTMSNISFTSPYFTYNGSSSQVSVADNALLEPGGGDWTIEIWVNQTVAGNDVVLGKFNNGGLAQNVSYSIRTTGSTYYAQIGSGSGSGSTLFVNSTNHVGTLNTWYQLVYVFKNGATKTLQTFVNGISIGTVNHNLSSILNSTNPLYIGSYNGGEYAQWFDGKIGVTRLYNSALTSAQALENFNTDRIKYGI